MLEKKFYRVENDNYIFQEGTFPRVSKILETVNWAPEALKRYEEKIITNYFISNYGKPHIGKELLKNALLEPKRELERTALFGNQVHDTVEDFLNTKKEIAKQDSIKKEICISSFNNWYNENNIKEYKSLGCEIPIFSKQFGYAGCLDWLAENKKIVLFDWKTSNAFRKKYYLQAVAYWHAVTEMYGLDIEEANIVVFNKIEIKHEVKTVTKEQFNYYFDLFKETIDLYNFSNK